MCYSIVKKGGDNVEQVVGLITQVGFPSAVAVVCLFLVKYIFNLYREDMKQRDVMIQNISNIVDNNTQAIRELMAFIEGGK